MALASGNFQELLEPRLREVFFDSYDEKPEEFSGIFKVQGSTKASETDQHVAGLGVWEKKDPQGPIKYEQINMADKVTYTHEEYAKGIQIERKLVDDEMYDVIDKLPKSLGEGGRVLVEQTAADILNNGFTVNGYDGVPLFSDAHPLRGNKGGTLDNVIDDVLSQAGIQAATTLLKKQVNEAGIKIQMSADTLIVPDDLEFLAMEILNSAGYRDTANRVDNQLKGKYKLVVLSYLTDPANWFLADSSRHELTFFWRVKPEFAGEQNFDTMVAKYRGYLRFSVGYSNIRGIVGSNPA